MEVFFVMLLVLVAGSVPSLGRTESKGTVFNKTQPHESMNSVTVSSSKLATYDYLYMVMQWPKSYCNVVYFVGWECTWPVPSHFTVHGLWPQFRGTGIDCKVGNYRPTYKIQQGRVLLDRLNRNWPDLAPGENCYQRFWRNEYEKHGSCTFETQHVYFDLTLTLAERLIPILSQLIPGPRILLGMPYKSSFIRNAVYGVTHAMPRLHCSPWENGFQLLEIRFCAKRFPHGIGLINCRGHLDCGNGNSIVFLPRP